MHLIGTNMNTIHGAPKPKRRRAQKVIATVLVLALVATGGVYALVTSYVRPPTVLPYTAPVQMAEEGVFFEPGHEENEWLPSVVPPPDAPNEPNTRAEAADPNRPSGIYTMLVVGKDEGGRTDTMLLVAVDSINSEFRAVSIPRDTLINMSGRQQKINAVLPLTRSMDRVMESVESLIGFKPDNYVAVDLDAFVALVDVLGGVYFDVPHNMRYSDPYQNLHIRVDRGWQRLDGETAMGVVRWRGDGTGDFGRMQTQQAFLRAVAGELLQVRNVTRIGELANIFTEHVSTDLPLYSIIWYANQMRHINSEDMQFFTMPTAQGARIGGVSYVIMDLEAWLPMINNYFNPYPSPVREENVQVFTRVNGAIQSVGDGRALTPTAPSEAA